MNKTPKLGQHFLKDARALKRIVSALDINQDDVVLEIGPGRGALTKHLLKGYPKKLIVVEKDKKLSEKLPEITEHNKILSIIEGDILKILPEIPPPYKLVGNIPYYLTGNLLRTISELSNLPELIILTTQKEVAERMCSLPPKMNLLSASVRFWGEPEIIRYISKKSFNPPPKVDSAIIKIIPHKDNKNIDSKKYYKTLKILFGQPRKTIANNLSGSFNKNKSEIEEVLNSLSIEPKLRPQNLNVNDIIKLSKNL